jgi:hypothetical protein
MSTALASMLQQVIKDSPRWVSKDRVTRIEQHELQFGAPTLNRPSTFCARQASAKVLRAVSTIDVEPLIKRCAAMLGKAVVVDLTASVNIVLSRPDAWTGLRTAVTPVNGVHFDFRALSWTDLNCYWEHIPIAIERRYERERKWVDQG